MNVARAALTLVVLGAPATAQTTIDFDDAPGQPGPFGEGFPVRLGALVDDEYLFLGVRFDSRGGGVVRTASANPVSAPNVVTSTAPGPVQTYELPAFADFWSGGRPGVVDSVSLALTSTSSFSTLEAYDFQGALVDTASGGAFAVLAVSAPGAIHSVAIQQGPMAFDDFTFDGLAPLAAFAVAPPLPGRAGTANELTVSGAAPFEPLLLQVDVSVGAWTRSAAVPLVADAAGRARHEVAVPAALGGARLGARVLGPTSGRSPRVTDVLAPLATSQ